MPYARVDNKERFRLPREVRDALDIHAGDSVAYAVVDGELRLRKANDPYEDFGRIARAVLQELDEHPERFRTFEEALKELGLTQEDIDSAPDIADE